MCGRAGAITLASTLLIAGIAAADPLAQTAVPSLAPMPEAAAPPAAGPVGAVPVRAVPAMAAPISAVPAAALSEPMSRAERSRIWSYILLQSLQGAGPFAAAR
jgi:hypothetical protein